MTHSSYPFYYLGLCIMLVSGVMDSVKWSLNSVVLISSLILVTTLFYLKVFRVVILNNRETSLLFKSIKTWYIVYIGTLL